MNYTELKNKIKKDRRNKIIQYSLMTVVALVGSAVMHNAIPKLEDIEEV